MIRTLSLFTLVLFLAPLRADIITRHDEPDERYLELAERFRQSIAHLNVPDCEGTILAGRWVLTAAHCAEFIVDKLEKGEGHNLIFDGRERPVQAVYLHPRWAEDEAYDLALVYLREELEDIQPAALYTGDGEAGRLVYVAGNGDFGDGQTGPAGNDGRLRAATNRVDEASDYWLKWRFEAPGDPEVTELEGISGPGDSGGPAFMIDGDSLFVVGVSSGQSTRATGGREGFYGVTEYYTRVSRYAGWIRSTIETERIAEAARAFSAAYVREDLEDMMRYYAADAAIFPTSGDILDTPEAIAKYWTVPEGIDVLHHESMSEDIQILGNTAYDYGYYQGRIDRRGEVSDFQGKYVIVWEKGADGQWRMKLDIWNRR